MGEQEVLSVFKGDICPLLGTSAVEEVVIYYFQHAEGI